MEAAAAMEPFTAEQTEAIASATQYAQGSYSDLNTAFTLSAGYLVFFMHCGFAMLSIGCVRARFAKHIAILILVDACASAFGFYLFGYAFAFGDSTGVLEDGTSVNTGNGFIGSNFFAMSDLPPDNYFLWFFQWTFAATACTIVSGAIAERAKFESYILYSFFMSAWVYPLVVHSIWSGAGWASSSRQPSVGGLLFESGAIDFAGSGAVHMVGGIAAACGCYILGPRIGRFLSDGTVVDMAGHNTSLFVLGVMILWFGWYGFNPGSTLGIVGYGIATANAAVATTLAPAASGLSSLATRALLSYKDTGRMVYDLGCMGNGVLAGLAAVTAGCSTVAPWGAIIIGLFAGVIYVFASKIVVACRLDDPLDAIAVHAFNGFWGVIAVGFLAAPRQIAASYGTIPGTTDERIGCGVVYGCSGRLLAAQIVYAIWVAGWVVANMLPFWYLINKLGWFRVAAADETTGLDDSYHGGSAYPGGPEEKDMSHKGGVMPGGEIAELRAEVMALKASIGKNNEVNKIV